MITLSVRRRLGKRNHEILMLQLIGLFVVHLKQHLLVLLLVRDKALIFLLIKSGRSVVVLLRNSSIIVIKLLGASLGHRSGSDLTVLLG
jgi:hypothetical protein